MSRREKSAAQPQQSRPRKFALALVLGVLVLSAALFWVLQGTFQAQTTGNATGAELNENDVASLEAAERGAVGTPVLVWFHAPW